MFSRAVVEWTAAVDSWIVEAKPATLRAARAILDLRYAAALPRWGAVSTYLELAENDPTSLKLARLVPFLSWLPSDDYKRVRLVALRAISLTPGEASTRAADEAAEIAAELRADRVRAFFLELGAYRRDERGETREATRRMLAAARILRGLGQAEEAEARVAANLGGLWFRRGRLRLARRAGSEAVANLRRLSASSTTSEHRELLASSLLNFGRVRRLLGERDAAYDLADEAFRLREACDAPNPDRAEALAERGISAFELGKIGTSQTDLSRARRLIEGEDPDATRMLRIVIVNHLALCLSRIGRRDEARHQLEELGADDVFTRGLLAVLDGLDGKHDEARAGLLRVVRELGDDISALPPAVRWAAAGTMNNLSVVARRARDYLEARRWGESASDLYATAPPDAYLGERVTCWVNLALLEFEEKDLAGLTAAREALRRAREYAERNAAVVTDSFGRGRARKAAAVAYELSVVCGAECWEATGEIAALEEALAAAEQGRARGLADLISGGQAPTNPSSGDDRPTRGFRVGRSRIATRTTDPLRPPPDDVPTAYVVLAVAGGGGQALIRTVDRLEAVNLPRAGAAEIRRIVGRWSVEHAEARRSGSARLVRASASRRLPRMLEELGDRVVRPAADRLRELGIVRAILVPTRQLHLVPLAACPIGPRRNDAGDRPTFGDAFDVVTVPSLAVLDHCLRPSRERGDTATLIVDRCLEQARVESLLVARELRDAEGTVDVRLTRSARDISSRSRVVHYSGHAEFDARRPLRSALDPSGLPSDRLSLRSIFRRIDLPHAELIVLSGCETGLVRPDSIDSAVGLTTGFLLAGARCVVNSLWAVDDLSCVLLMHRFYRTWLAGGTPSAALREASRGLREIPDGPAFQREALADDILDALGDVRSLDAWRREAERTAATFPDSPPFRSPYDWASFTVSGVGGPPGRPLTRSGDS